MDRLHPEYKTVNCRTTLLFPALLFSPILQVLVIETVGVQNERKMREAHDAFKGLGITMNDVPMQARVLTQEEEVLEAVVGVH